MRNWERNLPISRIFLIPETEGTVERFQHPTIYATTSLTMRMIQRQAELAEALIYTSALLAEEELPKALFVRGIAHATSNYGISSSEQAIGQALLASQGYEMFKSGLSQSSVRLHSVTRTVLRSMIEQNDKPSWQQKAVQMVNQALISLGPQEQNKPKTWNQEEWQLFDALYPHAEQCLTHIRQLAAGENDALDEDTALLKPQFFEQCHISQIENRYTLRDFDADRQIRLALESGEWIRLFGQGDDLSYNKMYLLETPEGQHQLRRMIMALFRVENKEQARMGLACMFFVTHYWWNRVPKGRFYLRAYIEGHGRCFAATTKC